MCSLKPNKTISLNFLTDQKNISAFIIKVGMYQSVSVSLWDQASMCSSGWLQSYHLLTSVSQGLGCGIYHHAQIVSFLTLNVNIYIFK